MTLRETIRFVVNHKKFVRLNNSWLNSFKNLWGTNNWNGDVRLLKRTKRRILQKSPKIQEFENQDETEKPLIDFKSQLRANLTSRKNQLNVSRIGYVNRFFQRIALSYPDTMYKYDLNFSYNHAFSFIYSKLCTFHSFIFTSFQKLYIQLTRDRSYKVGFKVGSRGVVVVLTWVDTWCRTMSISGNRLNLRNQGGHRMTHNSQSLRELWVAYKYYFVLF